MLAIWSLVPLPFLKPAWISGSSRFTYCRRLAWKILSITLLMCAAAAAKSLQSCPTLCDPIDSSPPSLGFSRQEHWSGLPFSSPVHESEKQNWSCTVESNTTSNTTNETATKIDLIVKYINITDRQEESDRSNQGAARPDYAEPLIMNHASSNHHVPAMS